jgi:hypothetical protein
MAYKHVKKEKQDKKDVVNTSRPVWFMALRFDDGCLRQSSLITATAAVVYTPAHARYAAGYVCA